VILFAPKVSLVVHKDLHPAIQYLLLDAAVRIHSRPGIFQHANQFPAAESIVSLEANSEKGYALSVENDGSALPEDFNPANRKGLGMRIIRSFVKQIGGELRISRDDTNQGARFTVLFS